MFGISNASNNRGWTGNNTCLMTSNIRESWADELKVIGANGCDDSSTLVGNNIGRIKIASHANFDDCGINVFSLKVDETDKSKKFVIGDGIAGVLPKERVKRLFNVFYKGNKYTLRHWSTIDLPTFGYGRDMRRGEESDTFSSLGKNGGDHGCGRSFTTGTRDMDIVCYLVLWLAKICQKMPEPSMALSAGFCCVLTSA